MEIKVVRSGRWYFDGQEVPVVVWRDADGTWCASDLWHTAGTYDLDLPEDSDTGEMPKGVTFVNGAVFARQEPGEALEDLVDRVAVAATSLP